MFTKSLGARSRRRALLASTAATVIVGFGAAAHAATPIDTAQPFYNQSDVGTTVNPDFQGGTLRDNVNAVTDTHAYNIENFPTNTLDEFGNAVTFTGTFSGAGPLTLTDSVGGGNAIFTGTSVLGGAVTVDTGAKLTWGNGTGGAFLIGPGNAVVDNGSLVMDFGGASGVVGAVPISGTGSVTVHSGLFEELGPATYTGGTTIDAAGTLTLGNGGSSVGTVVGAITDNGALKFDYAGAGPVTSANAVSGTGAVEFVSGTTVITGASAVGGKVTIDVGATSQWGDGTAGAFLVGGGNVVNDNGALVMNFGPSGIVGNLPLAGTGTLEIQSGSFEETGVATFSGTTTIDAAGTLALNGAGSISNSGGVIDNGVFDISGTAAGTPITTLSGSGGVSLGSQTLTLTNASGTFSGVLSDGGAGGGLTIQLGTETLTGTNTFTGPTTIDLGATLVLGNGGTTGTVAGGIVDNGLVQFDYSGSVTTPNSFSGTGSVEAVAGTLVVTNTSFVAGNVTIDPGATMQWGNGGPAFLVGAGNSVIDNGALTMNFGGGGITGAIPISGSGTLEIQSGSLNDAGASTFTGTTTIDAPGVLALTGAGSMSNSSDIIDNGVFDISGTAAGTSVTTLEGAGGVSLGAQTLTLTNASGTFSGVLADGGLFGGVGGGLTIGGGAETLTGTNTYTGPTTIDLGATLVLGNGGTTGTVAGNVVDNGLVQFDYSGSVTTPNSFSGTGSVEDVAGTVVVTNTSFVAGNVTIDPGATMQWGNGGPAFLVGAGNSVIDNGALTMNFGGGGITGAIPISGSGTLEIQSGSLNDAGASTFTGTTTIDAPGVLALTGAGSMSNSSDIIDNGVFDISGTAAGTSVTTLEGAGGVSLGAQTLTLTNASGTFSGVLADGGLFGGTGGGLTIGGGTETLTGTNTYTGPTTIDLGATLKLGNGGTTGTVAGSIVDNGLVQFDYSGSVTTPNSFSGAGSVEAVAGTLVVTNTSFVGGNVTIDPGATMQWGNGGPAFLVGAGNSVIDNGALTMNFGGGGITGAIPISGTGTVDVQSGEFSDSGASTYTGVTTIDAAGTLALTGAGSIADSANLFDNGKFDISGTTAGASITTLEGAGGVSLGAQTLTLTNAAGTFSGVIADGGLFGGTGGALTIAGGTETLTGVNTYTGLTTIDLGATLNLVGGGSIADSADPLVNGTFNISGASGGVDVVSLSGSGHVILGANTLTLTNASDLFSGFISGTGGLTIGAGTETLTGVNTFTGTTLIDTGATLQLGNGGGAVGLLAGPITDNGQLTFNGGAGSDAIFATAITGSGAMTLASGTLGLTGTNTYAGPTTVDVGATLQLGAGGTTGTVAGAVVDNGLVQFNYSGSVTTPNAFSGAGSAEVVAGTVVFTGPGSALGGAVTVDPGATMQWGAGNPTFLIGGSGGVVDNGALVLNFGGGGVGGTIPISGTGTFELVSGSLNNAGVSTYTGATTIDSTGFLLLSGAGSISDSSNVIDNGTFDISGTTAGTSIVSLTGAGGVSLGAQTLTLTNASGAFSGVLADGGLSGGTGGALTIASGTETLTGTNTFTGATTIDLGATLKLGNGGATGTVAGAIVDNGLVQFDYAGAATMPGDFSGGGSAEVVAGTLVVTGDGILGGTVTIDPGATMQWGSGGPAFLLGAGDAVVDNGALLMNFGSGGIAGSIPISGTGSVTLQSGAFNDGGASIYTGATTIDAAGAFRLTGTGSIADSSNVIDNGKFDISGTTAGASIITLSGSGGVSLGGQTLTLTNASGTFSGVMADGGFSGGTGGKLTIAAGTEILSGANTYTGLTTIDLGATLDLVGAGSIADSGDPLVNGTFDISGVSGGGTSVVSLSGSGHVILGANTLTLSNAADLFSGFISGTGGLTLAGGTEILTGVNTFTGTTLIDTGATLQLGAGAGVGLLAGPITDNGLLLFDGGAGSDTIYATAITGSGALTLEAGILGLTGTNTYAGQTTVDAGATLQLGAGGTTGTVAGQIADNGLVQFNYSGSVTTPNTIFGTGSAEVVAGTLVVTAASAIGGTVTIDSGATMQWGAGNAAFLVGGGDAVVDNGALVMNFGGGGVAGSIPVSGTGTVDVQSGEFSDSGASTYTGVTTIDAAGIFRLSGAGSIADSAEVFDNGVFDISGTTAGTAITTLSGAGGVSLGARTLTLTNASGTFSGVLADGGAFGGTGGGLTIAAGTETLTGTNTYTGATTIDLGATLKLGNGGATGTVAGAVFDNGLVQFDYSGAATLPGAFSGTGSAEVVAGTLVVTGASALGGTVTIDHGSIMQWGAGNAAFLIGGGGGVVDNGALVMNFGGGGVAGAIPISGTGTVDVQSGAFSDSGASTYTGVTTIDAAGTLALAGAGSIADSANLVDSGKFDISGTTGGASIVSLTGAGGVSLGGQKLTLTNASGTFSGVLADGGISGGTGGALTIASGTETLTGTNTYTGATTIDLGATLKLGAGGATGTVAGAIFDNGLVQFDYSGSATLPGAFSGTGSAELIAGTLVVTGASALGGTVTIDHGSTMQWGAGNAAFLIGGGGVVDNGALVMNFGGGGVAGVIPISGTGTVDVQSGAFSDSGVSTYTGATTIDAAGTLALAGAGSIADSANLVDSGKFDISGTTGGASIITLSGSGGVSLGAQTLMLTDASGTFSGVIADGGLSGGTGGRLTIAAGTETLTGVNTFTGLTTIDLGATLDLVGAGSIADSGDPLVNGTFDISGVSGGGTSVVSLSGSGQVILGANTLTLSHAADLFPGVISGTGGLTIGAGGEILAGANTYTGPTLIDTGAALQLGDGAGLHVLAGPITDNGVLIFDGGAASSVVYSQVIAGTGALTLASGTLGLTGTNTLTGVTTINTGAKLQFGEDTATGTVAGNVVDNGAVAFDFNGTATMPGAFSGSGTAEIEDGTLLVTVGGALGGAVTIDTGATLQWGNGAAAFLVGGGGAVVDNGALVMDFGAGSVGGSIPISGTGTLEVKSGEFGDSGASTYTGVTTVDTAGVLALSGAGSIADSSNLIDNGKFDISGTTGGASIITLSGTGGVSLGAQTLTLTNASGTFSGMLADGGLSGGTGGGLTIAAGTETLTGANTFTGLTTIKGGATLNLGAGGGAGSLVGPVVDNGTLVLDRSNTLTFAQSISGAGAIDQVGAGTTVLDAVNPFTGLTTVSAGALEVGDAAHAGATLGGNVVVGAGGTLMGHGTIAGSVTNFGVVAPGGAIGTLTVGSYKQAVGGTLAIEVSPSAASMLNVLGPASLAGKLALTFDPGAYNSHIYEIVAGHPVTGTFSTVSETGTPSGDTFGVFYAPTQVDLVTEATANAQVYGAISAATLDRAQNFATLVEDRFGDAVCPDGSTDKSAPGCQGFGAWAFAIGSWSNQDANGGALGFHNDGAGVIGGIDRSWENGSLVGAAFGYAHNDLDMTAGGAKASGPSYYGAIYGRLVAEGGLWFDGQAFYMRSGWSVDRTMPGFGVASASPDADSEGFLLQASAPIGDTSLRPYGRITYVFSNRGGALEQGAGPLGFQINSASQSAAVGEVGLQYAPTFTTGGGIVLRPALEVGVQENGGDRGQVISGSLDGLPGSAFNEAGPRLWGVAGVVDGSLKVRVNQSFELFGDVRGRFGDHQTDGVASIGGVFRF